MLPGAAGKAHHIQLHSTVDTNSNKRHVAGALISCSGHTALLFGFSGAGLFWFFFFFFTCIQLCIFRIGLDCRRQRIFKFKNPLTLSLRTHLRVLLKKIRDLGNHLQVAVSCLRPRFGLVPSDCTKTQTGELWATIMERNTISVIISIAQCCIFYYRLSQ